MEPMKRCSRIVRAVAMIMFGVIALFTIIAKVESMCIKDFGDSDCTHLASTSHFAEGIGRVDRSCVIIYHMSSSNFEVTNELFARVQNLRVSKKIVHVNGEAMDLQMLRQDLMNKTFNFDIVFDFSQNETLSKNIHNYIIISILLIHCQDAKKDAGILLQQVNSIVP